MRHTFLSLAILVLTAAWTSAQDTVLLANGDVLTGTIIKQDSERVYFRSAAFGTVSLSTRDIAEIRIHAPEVGEITVPSSALADTPPPEPLPTVEVQAKPKADEVPAKEEKSRWSGQTGLAIAMRESNTLRRQGDNLKETDQQFETYRVYGNLKWEGEQNTLRWDWTYRYSRTDLRKDDDYFNVTQNYQYDLSKQYYTACKTLYQQDFRRGIEHEYLQTAEVGVNWFNQPPNLELSTSVGGGYHKYERVDQAYSDANAKFILEEALRWQMVNSLTLFQKYSHLGNLEKYHMLFTAGLENKLVRDVFLRVEYRLDRDTDVDYYDKSYYDKALLTSVLYKF